MIDGDFVNLIECKFALNGHAAPVGVRTRDLDGWLDLHSGGDFLREGSKGFGIEVLIITTGDGFIEDQSDEVIAVKGSVRSDGLDQERLHITKRDRVTRCEGVMARHVLEVAGDLERPFLAYRERGLGLHHDGAQSHAFRRDRGLGT